MEPHSEAELTEAKRQTIFRTLVEAQDNGANVTQSRTTISKQFGISAAQLAKIEREGIEGQWPPLS